MKSPIIQVQEWNCSLTVDGGIAVKIESITIQNYKIFEKAVVADLPGMAVFLGKNGSGKTTFFDVFGFLHDCLNGNRVEGRQYPSLLPLHRTYRSGIRRYIVTWIQVLPR